MYLEYFETTAEDFMDHCYWDEALKQKMRESVAANGHQCFDLEKTRKMIDFAWFENPHRPVEISMWDEASKRKMRQPLLGNGYHHLSDESLRMLVTFV
jgi:hypothetical protein